MNEQTQESRVVQAITLWQHKHYSCLAKIFCCRCIHCCQELDFSLLTSENRKSSFQKTVKRYLRKLRINHKLNVIMDPFFILVALLLGEQSETYAELMALLADQTEPTIFSKQDLQFYIPQLCTYLVFHEELHNVQLENLLVRACKVDIHFSLRYYFHMRSLEVLALGQEIRHYPRVSNYNSKFRIMISKYYQQSQPQSKIWTHHTAQIKSQHSVELQAPSQDEKAQQTQIDLSFIPIRLQNKSKSQCLNQKKCKLDKTVELDKIKTQKLRYLQQNHVYHPFIGNVSESSTGLFDSTVNFFWDLVQLSKLLVTSSYRTEQLRHYLILMNDRLPANVYVPFTSDCYQDLNILNIVYQEAKVFNTKQRAPIYLCMQSFCNPAHNEGISKDKKIRSLSHLKNNMHLNKSSILHENISDYEDLRESQVVIQENQETEKQKASGLKKWSSYFILDGLDKIKRKIVNRTEVKQQPTDKSKKQDRVTEILQECKSQTKQEKLDLHTQNTVDIPTCDKELFDRSQADLFQKVRQTSPFSNLPGYKLIHLIVKSYDDLRQESFAMSLLQQFQKIFRMQKIAVKLLPYEVLPFSHQAGILQFVTDAITIDELRKRGGSLKGVLNSPEKIRNFVSTLAGYSIVTYLMQVKDRHNGNIMIRKDGYLFHIDYGFFMSNSPGKGVQLEANLPFKLTIDYVQALGGTESRHFKDFRRLFYRGFNACRKHQHRILILTKLMYSSYGKTMPCFIKGQEAISNLQQRFNPPGRSDAEVSAFCQGLVNSSIDNWRSRWYDKWQYYFQGVFY